MARLLDPNRDFTGGKTVGLGAQGQFAGRA